MTFFNNKKHFLHKHLTFLELYGEEEIKGGFTDLLNQLGIKTGGESWNIDHSTIDWTQIENHFQFFFDYDKNEKEIKSWLKKSPLSSYDTMLTWISFDDPIVRIKTSDFIENWEEFNIATGGQGLILTTEDGKYFLEFTDDWKFHLKSNFEIKPEQQ
ncbi:hypothetical protein [Maribacter sp. Asnod2-G09]|uniref:hypothetical protein n=1 Tax=Maribacter sp. Asnod2-G09 TaxID=3160577 RepID=UPI003869A988